ncbi:MAG: hypothetical protein ACRC6V_14710 [Bacteroidales bacterium]
MAKLDFPANPQPDQEYHFPPFTYRWDGEKWKTLGRGSTPVTDAINEHKADPKAHSPFVIGAFPMKGTSLDITDLNSLTASLTDEGFYYQDVSAKALVDAYHYPVQEAGALVVSRSAWGVQQEYTSYNTGRKYSRGKINHTDWLPWKEYFINDGTDFLRINRAHGAISLRAPNATDPCYVLCTTAGVNNWYVGKGGTTDDVILSSYKNSNYISIRSDRVEAFKPLYVGANIVRTSNNMAYIAGYNIAPTTIAASSAASLIPRSNTGSREISLNPTNGEFTVPRAGTYRITFGYSVEPATVQQQSVGEVLVNDGFVVNNAIYNYCPANPVGTSPQMGVSSFSGILTLKANDKVRFRVKSVNGTTVKIWNSGHIVIEEM